MQSGGLQRPAGATLSQVEVLPRQLDDRPVEVDGVSRDAAWVAEGGAIQAIWRPSSLDYNPGYLAATASRGSRSAVRLKQPELCSLELSVLAGRLEPWLVSAAAVRTARFTMLSCGRG